MIAVWVALAGAAGAVCRFVLDSVIRDRFAGSLPVGTIVINVTGSLLLGLLTGAVVGHGQPHALVTVAGTGFCGGYTTFSTASFEVVRLLQQRRPVAAVSTLVAGSLLPLLAAGLGLALSGGFDR